MKEKLNQIKEFTGKLSSKTKKIIIIGMIVLVLGAVGIALILNNRPYGVLFSGLGVEEAQEIVAKLQEDGVDFRYQGDSTILVKEDQLDVTKAKLVQEGYPKSGFTYDLFKENAGMMTTDSDKNTYKLYQLQDRIGSTIRLFKGVKDAKVTIALGEESKYALSSDAKEKSSATAVITMEDGGAPTEEQAVAIQRLVAKSIPDMAMEDVAVFDGNGNDVSNDTGAVSTGSDAEEIAQVVEEQIAQRVMKILGSVYGEANVRVSARAKINMEKLIRESTTYNTPEKIDENDKTGIVNKEESYKDESSANNGAAGVAGADANADTPQYSTNGGNGESKATSESVSKEYLVDQIKEQGQVDPGALDDLTVSVAINGSGYGSLDENQVRSLVANASGISAEDQETKITIVSAPFYKANDKKDKDKEDKGKKDKTPTVWIVVGVIVGLLVIALGILFVLKRKKKNNVEEEIEEPVIQQQEETSNLDMNQELQQIQNDRGMELKKNIRDFAEQNAEISAQLLKNWLNGGDGNGE